ncbi:hypothetical protein nbrc107696_42460 [Gordonia spumicola]|uniref:Uncharacterized protein n=1 Tax=Gordonia spumicola TaxID=589161 RepID=A0A7I9VFK4_9ACTN|nr:hypothetical protein nbrc107696_42460 [Gordonia spumicola]
MNVIGHREQRPKAHAATESDIDDSRIGARTGGVDGREHHVLISTVEDPAYDAPDRAARLAELAGEECRRAIGEGHQLIEHSSSAQVKGLAARADRRTVGTTSEPGLDRRIGQDASRMMPM